MNTSKRIGTVSGSKSGIGNTGHKPKCEPLFSEWSYGFRPDISGEMAVRQLPIYLNEDLQLKARVRKISKSLKICLTVEYGQALEMLEKAVQGFTCAYQYWSAEFAVRAFLTSEGCRPQFPGGQTIVGFKKDPAPVIPILEQLKNDSSLYVRKGIAKNRHGATANTDWMVKNGCGDSITFSSTILAKKVCKKTFFCRFEYKRTIQGSMLLLLLLMEQSWLNVIFY